MITIDNVETESITAIPCGILYFLNQITAGSRAKANIKAKNITITTLFIVQRSHIPDKLINTTNKALVDNTI